MNFTREDIKQDTQEIVTNALEEFGLMVKAGFDAVDQRFDGVDQRFDGVDQRLDRVEGRLDGVEGRLDRVENRMDSFEDVLEDVAGKTDRMERILRVSVKQLDDHGQRITKLETKTT